MNISEKHVFAPVNACIYCGKTDCRLTIEHIVPLSLGGRLELPEASCDKCQKATRHITEHFTREIYGNLRERLGFPSRRAKKHRPTTLPLQVQDPRSGAVREVQVPVQLYPRHHGIMWGFPPALITGKSPHPDSVYFLWAKAEEDLNELRKLGFIKRQETVFTVTAVNPLYSFRQLAQIAHAYAVAIVGLDGYERFLPPLIVGPLSRIPDKLVVRANDLIGPAADHSKHIKGHLNLEVVQVNSDHYLTCLTTIADLGLAFPTYQVVCGKITEAEDLATISSKILETEKRWTSFSSSVSAEYGTKGSAPSKV